MKIAYCSDTHVDFALHKSTNPEHLQYYIIDTLKPEPADIIVVAGDISHYNNQSIVLLNELKTYYPIVACTGGNHDLYLINSDQRYDYKGNSFKKLDEFKKMCKQNDIVYFDGNTITINGIVIGGCMGWYRVPNTYDWLRYMNDGHKIQRYTPPTGIYGSKEPTFNPNEYFIEETNKIPKCDVFVSHVAQVLHLDKHPNKRYEDSDYNMYYEADNIELLKKQGIQHHIFGHSHAKEEFEIDGIKCYTSSIGYQHEYLPHKIEILEIKDIV